MQVSLEKPGTPTELVHAGIKGMRWGVRKERETSDQKPAKKISDRKKNRAQKHEEKVKQAQKNIDAIRDKPAKSIYGRYQQKNRVKNIENYQDRHAKAAKDIREGHMTDTQKKVLIGVGVTVVVLGAYGAYKLHGVRVQKATQLGDRVIGVSFKKNESLARTMTSKQIMEEVVPQVNPGFKTRIGARTNCLRCSFAYELRRRGYDVTATHPFNSSDQTSTMVGRAMSGNPLREFHIGNLGQHDIPVNLWGKDIVKTTSSERASVVSSKIFEALSKHENGARGELGLGWKVGGAHSVAWEKIAGRVHIFDTQTGKHFKSPEEFLEYAKNIGGAAFTRLDNVDIDESFLTEWAKDVK